MTIVKAGAGAGKTYTIQTRLTDWVLEGSVQPDRILAVTFTKAAAGELRERIRLALMEAGRHDEAARVQQSTITTIHSFGLQLMQSFAYDLGMSPQPRQLTDAEQQLLTRSVLAEQESLDRVLYRLREYGYTGQSTGSEFISGAEQFKGRIMQLVASLRSLGTDVDRADWLIEQAKRALGEVYGTPALSGAVLDRQLLQAAAAVRDLYDEASLLAEWGSSKPARGFVRAIFALDEASINDWGLWVRLQELKAPRIRKGDYRHQHAELAENIWLAADRLSEHPGPLEDAAKHLGLLLQGAIQAVDGYQQQKHRAGLVDYPDMVQLAERLLHNQAWRSEAAGRYDCLIIDEFQDTNPLQFALLYHFQQAGLRTLIVGDRKQSIMRFQGADPRLFASLADRCGDDTGHRLEDLDRNWRSTPELMGFLNAAGRRLFPDEYTELAPQASLRSGLMPVQRLLFRKEEEWISHRNSRSAKPGYSDSGWFLLAEHLRALLDSGAQVTDRHTGQARAIRPRDIAVLAMTHGHLDKCAGVLQEVGLESSLSAGGFLESPAVRSLVNALQYLQDPGDRFALLDLLTDELIGSDLQDLLRACIGVAAGAGGAGFGHPLEDTLAEARPQALLAPLPEAVQLTIAALELDARIRQHPQAQQLRADILKLISLAEVFSQLQPESQQAMGIYGKSISAFLAWLEAEADSLDERPDTDPDADNAVVLKTWHGSKGLEWPVVVVLDLEKARDIAFPALQPAYPDFSIDTMLQDSFLQILPEFHDSRSTDRCRAALAAEHERDTRSLTYVALTRAREQLILPWYHTPRDNSPQQLLGDLFGDGEGAPPVFRYENIIMHPPTDGQRKAGDRRPPSRWYYPQITPARKDTTRDEPDPLPGFLEPSAQQSGASAWQLDAAAQKPDASAPAGTTSVEYGPPLDAALLTAGHKLAATDLGTAVHRLYQVFCMQPDLLPQALALPPFAFEGPADGVQKHLQSFVDCLRDRLMADHLRAEQYVSAANGHGQTLYGTIDLIAETPQGLWIIDHKTDRRMDLSHHLGQLFSYAAALDPQQRVAGVGINWTAHGTLELLSLE